MLDRQSQRNCVAPTTMRVAATFISPLICICAAQGDSQVSPPTHSPTAFSDVVISKHMLCVDDREFLRKNLAAYQKVLIGKTVDDDGVTERTNTIFVNPSTRDVVIVGVNRSEDAFCIIDFFKDVQIHHSEVLDGMEGRSSEK